MPERRNSDAAASRTPRPRIRWRGQRRALRREPRARVGQSDCSAGVESRAPRRAATRPDRGPSTCSRPAPPSGGDDAQFFECYARPRRHRLARAAGFAAQQPMLSSRQFRRGCWCCWLAPEVRPRPAVSASPSPMTASPCGCPYFGARRHVAAHRVLLPRGRRAAPQPPYARPRRRRVALAEAVDATPTTVATGSADAGAASAMGCRTSSRQRGRRGAARSGGSTAWYASYCARALPRAGGRAARRRRDAHPRAARRRLQRQRAHLRRLPQPDRRGGDALSADAESCGSAATTSASRRCSRPTTCCGRRTSAGPTASARRRRLRRRHRPRHAALGDGGAAAGGHLAVVIMGCSSRCSSPTWCVSAPDRQRTRRRRACRQQPPPPAAAALTPSPRARAPRWASCCGRTASWRTP